MKETLCVTGVMWWKFSLFLPILSVSVVLCLLVLHVSHLYPVLGQLCLHGEHLSGVDVRVMSLLKSFLQLLQLVGGEHGSAGHNTTSVTLTHANMV